jgi:hypothetical protein
MLILACPGSAEARQQETNPTARTRGGRSGRGGPGSVADRRKQAAVSVQEPVLPQAAGQA